MRPGAIEKLGFYPAHPEAVDGILAHLKLKAGPDEVTILDPCAGRGEALARIAFGLAIPGRNVYAVELDGVRAAACVPNLPVGARVLGPAAFKGSRITGESFSLAYVNPPFDDELGGGKREEHTFAEVAESKLVTGGILAFVLPLPTLASNLKLKTYLDGNFTDAAIFAFPPARRDYNEVVYIARKRSRTVPVAWGAHLYSLAWRDHATPDKFPIVGSGGQTWELPKGHHPGRFEKIDLTEQEMIAYVNNSRLLSIFDNPPEPIISRPPLPPYTGHIAQLLAAGMLNGVVESPGEPPHVVRGTAEKEDVRDSIEPILNEAGDKIGEREVWIQIVKLTVRALGLDGIIKTFKSSGKEIPA